MKELATSIIQKVKDELQESGDLSATELYDLLHKYRSSVHPDRFMDEERKKDAEEKFKKLNSLLVELSNFIEQEKQQKKPSELIPYQKDYEIVKTKQQIIQYEELINRLEQDNKAYESEVKLLKKEMLKLLGDKVTEKTAELIKHYKPSKKNLVSQGVTFLITLMIGVLTKIEEVANILTKYFPFNPSYLNYLVFGVLVYIPIRFIKKYTEEAQIERTAKRIRTPLLLKQFIIYLSVRDKKDTFTEMNVYDFLSSELAPRNSIARFIRKNIYNLYNETTIDSLKDIFIYNLLNKQLITISNADQLDRRFNIVKTRRFNLTDFELDDPF